VSRDEDDGREARVRDLDRHHSAAELYDVLDAAEGQDHE
jgi:hypothetical protein